MRFHMTKVVTRNFIDDFINRIRNTLGADLPNFERRIDSAISELLSRMEGKKMRWHRISLTTIDNSAVVITLYGETS